MKNMNIRKGAFTAALATTISLMSLTGCTKKMDCDIEAEHAHIYTSDENFLSYGTKEYEHIGDLYWTEEIVPVTDEIEYMEDKDLLKIEENIGALEQDTKNDFPYIEYEYKYTTTTFVSTGKTVIPITTTHRNFTTDENHSRLTGRIRNVEYKYQAYKITTNKKGKKKLVKSDLVDNIEDIMDEYPYFKLKDFKQKVYSEPYEKESGKTYNK